jgi:purine nucleoside phosphorylase
VTTFGVLAGSGEPPFATRLETAGNVPVTPYGEASAPVGTIDLGTHRLAVLQRHGPNHERVAHEVNYRANLWALCEAGVTSLVALHTVGGIDRALVPGDVVLADQIIDYSWGRAHTFALPDARHVAFAEPYDPELRAVLVEAAARAGIAMRDSAVYGCTQGPRLETVAEIERMARDGCDVVGMTAMPEAALARELALPYASVCLVVNPAAGRGVIDFEDVRRVARNGIGRIEALLERLCEVGIRGE